MKRLSKIVYGMSKKVLNYGAVWRSERYLDEGQKFVPNTFAWTGLKEEDYPLHHGKITNVNNENYGKRFMVRIVPTNNNAFISGSFEYLEDLTESISQEDDLT